jgi:TonB family protein
MRPYLVFPLLAATLGAADTSRASLPLGAGTTGVWHISRALADVPSDASSPKLISAPQSSQRKDSTAGAVSVSFEINEKGLPIDIQVDKSSDKELDDEVIAMIREWRFEAALRGGVSLASRAYIDLSVIDLSVIDLSVIDLSVIDLSIIDLSVGDPPPVAAGTALSHSRKYYISGMVNKTGEVDLVAPTRISEALANAGGFKDFAKTTKISIIREVPGGKPLIFKYNHKEVSHGEELEQNIYLEPGDRIYVD